MHIDEAIQTLKEAKKNGTKTIILAYWEADMFEREDNEEWKNDAEDLDNYFDWSSTHDQISSYLESLKTP